MTTTALEIPWASTLPVTVDADEAAPGLLLHRWPDPENPWRITHHSGLFIGHAPTEAAARNGIDRLADLADWTRPAPDLAAALDRTEVHRLLQRAACHPAG